MTGIFRKLQMCVLTLVLQVLQPWAGRVPDISFPICSHLLSIAVINATITSNQGRVDFIFQLDPVHPGTSRQDLKQIP